MVRIFLAIDLPTKLLELLEEYQNRLRSAQADVRWVRPSNIHLTLKFMGELPESDVVKVVETCKDVCRGEGAFSLNLEGTGAFPNQRRPRVLWVGLAGDAGRLSGLQGRMEQALGKVGFPAEGRAFSPHLTIGRFRSERNLAKLLEIASRSKIASEPFPVEEVLIYESRLTPQGPQYTVLAKCTLG
jgi:2'-5' RNA ligase